MNDYVCAEKVGACKNADEAPDDWEKVNVLGCGEDEVFFSADRDDG
jgi:hypothetical protein